jgi:glycerophosphoryl diester phosphodiesterase
VRLKPTSWSCKPQLPELFNDMSDESTRPILFAHRGASAHAPENTLAAFDLALRHEADAFELDAKLSADGQVVVIHDQTVERTTDGKGDVRYMTLAALQELDAGSFFDIAFRGEHIPTLAQVFETFGHKTYINVELTNYASPDDDLPDRVVDLVKHNRLEKRVLFSSFNPRALLKVKRLIPDVPVGLLALPGRRGWWARSWLGRIVVPYDALHPESSDVTAGLVTSVHHRGHRVNVWTVNQPEEMQRLFALGVDGIFTDDPRLARQVLTTSR